MQRNYDESYLKKIEKVEPFKIPTEADIEKIRKELNTKEEKCYSDSFICKNLRTKSSLRKVFLGVFKYNPAKISDVIEYTGGYKQNTYPLLAQLVNYKLLNRVFVSDILSGAITHDLIKAKFLKWTEHMAKPTRQYYAFKTSYWEINEFGKKYLQKAWDFEQSEKEQDEDGN